MYIFKRKKIKIKTPYTRKKTIEILKQNLDNKGFMHLTSDIMANCAIFGYSFEIAHMSRYMATFGACGKVLVENDQTIIDMDIQYSETNRMIFMIVYFFLLLLQLALLLDKNLSVLHFIPSITFIFLEILGRAFSKNDFKSTIRTFLDLFDGEIIE